MTWSLHIVLPFYFRPLVTFLSIYFHPKNKKRKDRDLKKDIHVYNNIIYFFLFDRGKAIRFRWIQPSGYGKKQNWAVSRLYIGKGCPVMCNGHGKCSETGCLYVI